MKFLHAVLAPAALTGALMLAGPTVLRADNDCQKRTEKADHNLHEAIEHHGYNSSQAEHARHELNEARSYCWNHEHKWWDQDEHRWRDQRDWNDNDHHDHDHDQH
jgi:hypothetical protein